MSLKSRENIPVSEEIVVVASQSSFEMHARPSNPWLKNGKPDTKYKMWLTVQLHAIHNNFTTYWSNISSMLSWTSRRLSRISFSMG